MAKKKEAASRFSSPVAKSRFLKIMVEGLWGVGKTHFGLTFPKCAVIDPEHGTDLFMGRSHKDPDGKKVDFDFQCSYNRAIYDAIDDVESMRQDRGDRETLIVDPITMFWDQSQDSFTTGLENKIAANQAGNRKDANIQFGDWKDIKRPYKRLLNRLLGLPMHVILCARLSDDFVVDGSNIKKVGQSADAEKSTPYWADVIIRLEKKGSDAGPTRQARVIKDRSGLFEGKVIQNPSYFTFKPLIDRMAQFTETQDVVDEESASEKDVERTEGASKKKKENALRRRITANKKAFADIDKEDHYTTILQRCEALPLSDQDASKLQLVLDELANEYQTLKTEREAK